MDKDKLKEKFGEPEARFALGELYIWFGFLSGGLGIVGLAMGMPPKQALTGIVMAGIAFLLKRKKRIGLYSNYAYLAFKFLDYVVNFWAEKPDEWTTIAKYIMWMLVQVLWLRYFYRRRDMFTSSFFPL